MFKVNYPSGLSRQYHIKCYLKDLIAVLWTHHEWYSWKDACLRMRKFEWEVDSQFGHLPTIEDEQSLQSKEDKEEGV